MGTLTILVLTGPYSSRHPEFACEITEEALNKGHEVNMMFYMDGVHVLKKGQDPSLFPNISEMLASVIKRGVDARACVRTARDRGYVKEVMPDESGIFPTDEYVDGVKITTIEDFGLFVKENDKVIAINVR